MPTIFIGKVASLTNISIRCSPKFSDKIREIGLNNGADVLGITSAEPFTDIQRIIENRKESGLAGSMQFTYRNPKRSTDVSMSLEGVDSLVVCAVSYVHMDNQKPLFPNSRVAQYATSNAKEVLFNALENVSYFLRNAGWRTRILTDDNGLVDRAAAMRAGIGFYGKNALLINEEWGSTMLLGSVATTAPLFSEIKHSLERKVSGCGKCSACMPACPTGAIVAPGVIDAKNCLSWIAQSPDIISEEHRVAMGNRIYGCDECQDACPFNKIQKRRTSESSVLPTYLDLELLLRCSDNELIEIAGEWYVYNRDPKYLRRNVLINAGNVLPLDSPLWQEVSKWSMSEDQELSGYAQWALSQREIRKETMH